MGTRPLGPSLQMERGTGAGQGVGQGLALRGGISRQRLGAGSPSPSTRGGEPFPASCRVFLLLPGRRPAFSGSCFVTSE